jgi:hypothetical protein
MKHHRKRILPATGLTFTARVVTALLDGLTLRTGGKTVDCEVGRAQASVTALMRAALLSLALAIVVLCASSSGAASRSVVKSQDRLSCAWRIVAMSPWQRRETALFGLAASSGHDLWAVGYRSAGKHFLHRALIERWNGRRWAGVPSPRIAGPGNELKGVASASSADVWAVGHRDVPSGRRSRTRHQWPQRP